MSDAYSSGKSVLLSWLNFLEFVLFLALVDIYCTFGNISYRCPLFTVLYKVFLAVFWNELKVLSSKLALWVCSSVFLYWSSSVNIWFNAQRYLHNCNAFRTGTCGKILPGARRAGQSGCFSIYVHNYKTTTQPKSTEKVGIFQGYLWEQVFGVRSLETALFFDYS